MHAVMMENLEDYLAGTLEPARLRELEAHLTGCGACREEVRAMREVAGLFGTLGIAETESWNASPAFTAKVMGQIGQRRPASAFAGFFGLDLALGRRLVFASLLTLAVMGSYLVTREAQFPTGSSPEAILAQQNAPGFEANAENNMLVTLTAYEQ